MYLSNFNNCIGNVEFIDSKTFGSSITATNLFLISNYCFSEIDTYLQSMYIKMLFPKVSHGFMAWNFIPIYNFGFIYKEEDEYPLTGEGNKYIYF